MADPMLDIRSVSKFFGGLAAVNLVYEVDDLLAVGERKAVAAGGIFHRGLHAVALDRFDP